MKKYIMIYLTFLKNSIMTQMEYRFNFFLGLLVESGWVMAKLTYVYVIFHTNLNFFGLPKEAFFIFSGTYMLITGVYVSCFVGNFFRISDYIREGTLDLFITKPISLQFITTLRYTDLGLGIPNLIVGTYFIAFGWQQVNLEFDLVLFISYVAMMLNSIFLSYSVMLLPHLFSFWVINTSAVNDLSNEIWEFGHIPMSIYNKIIQLIGIYIVPLFIIGNFSSLILFNKLEYGYMIWSLFASITAFFITRLLWNRGLRNYSSASS